MAVGDPLQPVPRDLVKETESNFIEQRQWFELLRELINDIGTGGAGPVTSHSDLLNLLNDDHTQYTRPDGLRPFTSTIGGIDPVASTDLATKNYVDNSDKAKIIVTQALHGLSVQESIYFNGTSWAKAKADALTTIGTGVVQEVVSTNQFIVVTEGKITGLSGLATGEWYYTSDATAGLLTLTESAIYSNPMLFALSATEGVVLSLRAQEIGGSSQRVTRCEYDSVNAQYMYTGTADPGSATSSAVWRISRYDFSSSVLTYADGDQLYNNIWDNRESLSYS